MGGCLEGVRTALATMRSGALGVPPRRHAREIWQHFVGHGEHRRAKFVVALS
jgi:hypothetical protein